MLKTEFYSVISCITHIFSLTLQEINELGRTCSIGKLIRFYTIPRQALNANGGP
jgi:hypothetical protein